ncbi:MAG: peptidase [Gammaproteobacteria bacterium]|nr:peptidase [Gammaproteobacteria bacterium]
MICSFAHKGLERFFLKSSQSGIQAKHASRLRLILDRLSTAVAPEDINLPDLALHQLAGVRVGIGSVKVSGNWRVMFRFVGQHAEVVNYED